LQENTYAFDPDALAALRAYKARVPGNGAAAAAEAEQDRGIVRHERSCNIHKRTAAFAALRRRLPAVDDNDNEEEKEEEAPRSKRAKRSE